MPSLVDIQDHYKIIERKNGNKDSLADLAKDIIDPISYNNVKPKKPTGHEAQKFHDQWVHRELMDEQIRYVAIDAHVSFVLYRCVQRMRKCLKDPYEGKGKVKGKMMRMY